jgi:hypothetical protein
VPRPEDFLQARLGILGRPLRVEALDERAEGVSTALRAAS